MRKPIPRLAPIPALTLVLTLALTLSGAAAADSAIQAYHKFTDGLQTLRAHFTQSVLDTQNDSQDATEGTFELKRPDRFRWDYAAPDNRHIIADGSSLWVIDENLSHVTQLPESRALKGTPAQVLLANQPLDQNFMVSDLGEREGLQWLQLVPRTRDSDVVRLVLGFKNDQLVRLSLVDNFGQVTRFRFSDIQRNPDLPDSAFHYTPPKDWNPLNIDGG